MEINVILCPECESVYMLSGTFTEGDRFVTSDDNVTYLTVLPLDVRYMPYTVKLIGAKVADGGEMALSCKLPTGEYVLKLGKRYSFVFSDGHKNEPSDLACKFFYYVKGGHFEFARSLMSASLSASLGDESLKAFFNEFVDFLCVKGKYYAVDGAGVGHKAEFSFSGGLIDNISVE